MKILVTGANGFVGQNIISELKKNDHDISVLVRSSWKGEENVQVLEGDLLRPQTLPILSEEFDVAYYLVHGLAENQADFEYLEASCAINFLHWVKGKTNKIIYLGGISPDEKELSPHLRSRKLTGEILGVSGIPTLEFRASIILGKNSTSYEMIKAISERFPFRPKWKLLEQGCQPLSLEDLLKYLVSGIDFKVTGHKIVEIGGPDVFTYGELLDLFAKVSKLDRIRVAAPELDPKILGVILEHSIPEMSEVGKKLAESLTHSSSVQNQEALSLFPEIRPKRAQEVLEELDAQIDYRYTTILDIEFLKQIFGDKIEYINQIKALFKR